MQHLNSKEIEFYNSLLEDYHQRDKKSFLYTLFLGFVQSEEDLRKSLFQMYPNKKYQQFFNSSDLLLETENGFYIGKYKDTFFGVDTEGDIRGIGTEIQNIPANRINEEIRDIDDIEELIKYFQEEYQLNYKEYIKEYKDFCASFGLTYKEDLELMQSKSQNFNSFIKELKLYG